MRFNQMLFIDKDTVNLLSDEEKGYCMSLHCWMLNNRVNRPTKRRSVATYYHKDRGLNLCYECARKENVSAIQRGFKPPCITLKEHFWQCLKS